MRRPGNQNVSGTEYQLSRRKPRTPDDYPMVHLHTNIPPPSCLLLHRQTAVMLGTVGVASMRQEGAIASSSYNHVLVSSVKYNINIAPKCSILRSSNKKFPGRGLALSSDPSPAEGDTPPARYRSRRLGHLD